MELLAEVFLLFRVETFEKLRIPYLIGRAALRNSGEVQVLLWVLELASLCVDPLVEVVTYCAGYLHVHCLDVLVLSHLGSRELAGLLDLGYLLVAQADHYIFRLEVGVDDLAHPVNVVQADETLTS